MPDGTDADDPDPFAEYGEIDEKYHEPSENALGPDVPEAPEAPDLADRDVDPVVEGAFWTLVVVFNVGLIAFSVGVMLVVFQGRTAFGGQVTLAGAVILGYGLYRYRSARELVDERVGGESDDPSGSDHNE